MSNFFSQPAPRSGDAPWSEENTRLLLRAALPEPIPEPSALDRVEKRIHAAVSAMDVAQSWPSALSLRKLRIAVISYVGLVVACGLIGAALHRGPAARLESGPAQQTIEALPKSVRYPVPLERRTRFVPPNSCSFASQGLPVETSLNGRTRS